METAKASRAKFPVVFVLKTAMPEKGERLTDNTVSATAYTGVVGTIVSQYGRVCLELDKVPLFSALVPKCGAQRCPGNNNNTFVLKHSLHEYNTFRCHLHHYSCPLCKALYRVNPVNNVYKPRYFLQTVDPAVCYVWHAFSIYRLSQL